MTTRVPPILIRRLYKDLIRYGEELQLTNRQYYFNRIRDEFYKNKELTSPQDISFNFERGKALLAKKSIV